jgi:transposase InsO family protein
MGSDNESSGGSLSSAIQSVPKLGSPDDWIDWKRSLQNALDMVGYGDLLDDHKERPTARQEESRGDLEARIDRWTQRQRKACAGIKHTLTYNALQEVENVKEAAKILQILAKIYQPRSSAMFNDLQTRFDSLRLSDCKDISEYASQLRELHNKIQSLDKTSQIGSPQLIMRFLNGLGPEYNTFKTAFQQTHSILPVRDDDDPERIITHACDITTVVAGAQEEECSQKSQRQESALYAGLGKRKHKTQGQRNVPQCTHCGKRWHTEDRCWDKHPERKASDLKKKEKVQAHLEANTRTLGSLARDPSSSPQANYAAMEWAFAASTKQMDSLAHSTFILDSGASQHIVCRKDGFQSLRAYTGPSVRGFGGHDLTPLSEGPFTITGTSSGIVTLSSALYMPQAHVNLVSMSALDQEGHSVEVKAGRAIVKRKASERAYFTATLHNGIYIIDHAQPRALAATQLDGADLDLWHRRLGHLGFRNIRNPQRMSTGIKHFKPRYCEACATGKQNEKPHTHAISKGSYPLEQIHIDIAYRETSGPHGEYYWIVMVDDFTRMTWVLPIRHKSELRLEVTQFLNLRERPERRCHSIVCDQGRENLAAELRQTYKDRGIEVVLSATDQHQQNGVAEAMNKVLLQMLSPTLDQSGLPQKYWTYLVAAIVHIRNRCPTKALPGTPYEAYFGEKPDLSHLRVLGSYGHALLSSQKRKKLGARTFPVRLLGYQGHTNYYVLDQNGKVHITNNVVFDERPVALKEPGAPKRAKRVRLSLPEDNHHEPYRPSIEGETTSGPADIDDVGPGRRDGSDIHEAPVGTEAAEPSLRSTESTEVYEAADHSDTSS